MTRAGVDDIKEIETDNLINRIKDADNDKNNITNNKLTVARDCNRKIDILLVLIVVIAGKRLNKDEISIIDLTINISLLSIVIVGASIKRIIKSKIVKILIRAKNANKVAADWELKR